MQALPRMRDDIRYGFAVGRVRVLEGRLLSPVTFERLIDAADLREQQRILSETAYGRYLETAETARDVERGLELSLAELYDEFLTRASLPDSVVAYFRIPHDFENLRLIIKARLVGSHASGELSALGSVPVEAYRHEGSGLPAEMDRLLHAWDGSEQQPDLDQVVATLDRELFAALSEAARKSRLPFLRDLTRLRIDLANARLFVRARAKGLPPAQVLGMTVPGGTPRLERLAADASRMSAEDLASAIIDTQALGYLPEEDLIDPERFDIMAWSLEAQRMRSARLASGGADPVLAYVLAREAEILLLRTAVAGRLSGLDAERIRERVRERLS